MTSTQAGAFAVLMAALASLCLLAVVGLPGLARLRFRHRLEVIRDECTDEVLHGHLRMLPSVETFLHAAETGSTQPRLLTLPRVLAVYWAMVGLGIDPRQVAPPPNYAELEPDERRIMVGLDRRLCAAYASYLNWGSPMSWLLKLIGMVIHVVSPHGRIVEAEEAFPAVARETLQNTGGVASRRSLTGHLYASR